MFQHCSLDLLLNLAEARHIRICLLNHTSARVCVMSLHDEPLIHALVAPTTNGLLLLVLPIGMAW